MSAVEVLFHRHNRLVNRFMNKVIVNQRKKNYPKLKFISLNTKKKSNLKFARNERNIYLLLLKLIVRAVFDN